MSSFFKVYGSQILSILAIVSLLGAGVIGQLPEEEVNGEIPNNGGGGGGVVVTDPSEIIEYMFFMGQNYNLTIISQNTEDKSYIYSVTDPEDNPMGYITYTRGDGYTGRIRIAVYWSLEGTILQVEVIGHGDAPEYFDNLYYDNFFDQYIGRSYTESMKIFEDIDIATGASYSSMGAAEAINKGRILVSGYI